MARITSGPKYRLHRAEGVDLGLKGKRSQSPKAPLDQKLAQNPGQHGLKRSSKRSDYGIQLRAKQKVKRMYLVQEKQFKNYYLKAKTLKGQVGDNLLSLLEQRLDNVIYKSGLSLSKDHARQLVSHKHVLVNGKPLNIASYQVRPNDVITVDDKTKSKEPVLLRYKEQADFEAPAWLQLEKDRASVKIVGSPNIEDIKRTVDVNLIIEFYSR